jgi:hypothetical protein
MTARIYKPSKTAMQSGEARTSEWVLEQDPAQPGALDPLMGYTGASDPVAQIKLSFETKEDAIAYAEKHGIAYRVVEPKARKPIKKSYADNFKFGRVGSWTH